MNLSGVPYLSGPALPHICNAPRGDYLNRLATVAVALTRDLAFWRTSPLRINFTRMGQDTPDLLSLDASAFMRSRRVFLPEAPLPLLVTDTDAHTRTHTHID